MKRKLRVLISLSPRLHALNEVNLVGGKAFAGSSGRIFPPTGLRELFVFTLFYATLWTLLRGKHIQ